MMAAKRHQRRKEPPGHGVRRQSAAATALWLPAERNGAGLSADGVIRSSGRESGVALRLPPQFKTRAVFPISHLPLPIFDSSPAA
jgi:hypothetical protein